MIALIFGGPALAGVVTVPWLAFRGRFARRRGPLRCWWHTER